MIDFVTAVYREDIFAANLGASDLHLKVRRGFTNVAEAYNAFPSNGITCYLHEDIHVPATFLGDLITAVDQAPTDWGVLGVAGVRMGRGKEIHGYILDRGKPWGRPITEAVEVDTLDELLLITRGDMIFDEQLPLDFYGADICMQARERGQKCYVIPAFCHHNSTRGLGQRTPSFYESQEKFRIKWK